MSIINNAVESSDWALVNVPAKIRIKRNAIFFITVILMVQINHSNVIFIKNALQ